MAFDFRWVALIDEVPHLVADHGFALPNLLRALGFAPPSKEYRSAGRPEAHIR